MQGNKAVFWTGRLGQVFGSSILNDREWHHIVGTRDDSGNVVLYVDGVQESKGTNNETVDTSGGLFVGKHGTKNESYFNGLIDEVSIYNRALTAAEIKAIFDAAGTIKKEVVVEVEKDVTVEKLLVATPTPLPAGQARFGGTFRIAAQGGVSGLDPVFSPFVVIGGIASHFYEGLFGWDGNLEAAPRGVSSWSVSPDGLTYTFTLRRMLFHDGTPFESEDAVASLKRWRDGGTTGATVVKRFTDDEGAFTIFDNKTFAWRMNEPLGALIFILSVPHPPIPMMPMEVAATPSTEAVKDRTGTAAYGFSSWTPGVEIVLQRFDGYIPRAEASAPGAYSGENIAYIDRLVWLEISSEETKIAGLETGAWDIVDNAGLDFFVRVNSNPDLIVPLYKPGKRSNVYLNPQIPPFRYQKARQAIMTAIKVEDFMFSLGPPDLWIVCAAVYWCGTPLETDFGSRYTVQTSQGPREIGYNVNDVETAKILLSDSDYAGETTVILNPTDYGTITPLGHVLKPVMEEVGFVTEMPALDWATITSMFGATDSYSAITDWYEHYAVGTPITDHLISGTFDFIVRDEELLRMQNEFLRANPSDQLSVAERIQARRWEIVTSLSLGIWFPISPATKDLKNFDVKAINFYTNTWLDR